MGLDDRIYVRGIPMSRTEVFMHQERLGAQLFDPSMFDTTSKIFACGNVINELDRVLKGHLVRIGLTELPDDVIVEFDIGDPSWRYIPVKLFASDSVVQVRPTKDAPAGRVAWFRTKKLYKTGQFHARNEQR